MAIGVDIGASGTTTVDDDGRLTRHVVTSPHPRVWADLTSRVGDPVPMIFRDADGTVRREQAHEMYASEVACAVRAAGVTPEQTNGRGIVVAIPAWWTTQAATASRNAIQSAVGQRVLFVNDAEATIRGHRAEHPDIDDVVAVLDLGARTTSASIVQQCQSPRPQLAGRAAACVNGAGDELDAKILHHLLTNLQNDESPIDENDPQTIDMARDLLEQCRMAKHSLSVTSAATIDMGLFGSPSRVRLVRDELDEISLPWAEVAATTLETAINSSGKSVRSVLLIGGGAFMPLAAQTVSGALGLEVITSSDAPTLTASGAMLAAADIDHRPKATRARSWRRRDKPAPQTLREPRPSIEPVTLAPSINGHLPTPPVEQPEHIHPTNTAAHTSVAGEVIDQDKPPAQDRATTKKRFRFKTKVPETVQLTLDELVERAQATSNANHPSEHAAPAEDANAGGRQGSRRRRRTILKTGFLLFVLIFSGIQLAQGDSSISLDSDEPSTPLVTPLDFEDGTHPAKTRATSKSSETTTPRPTTGQGAPANALAPTQTSPPTHHGPPTTTSAPEPSPDQTTDSPPEAEDGSSSAPPSTPTSEPSPDEPAPTSPSPSGSPSEGV